VHARLDKEQYDKRGFHPSSAPERPAETSKRIVAIPDASANMNWHVLKRDSLVSQPNPLSPSYSDSTIPLLLALSCEPTSGPQIVGVPLGLRHGLFSSFLRRRPGS
jgi:hypothetical protein